MCVYTALPTSSLTPVAAITPHTHTCTLNRDPLPRKRVRKEFNKTTGETVLTRHGAWPDISTSSCLNVTGSFYPLTPLFSYICSSPKHLDSSLSPPLGPPLVRWPDGSCDGSGRVSVGLPVPPAPPSLCTPFTES